MWAMQARKNRRGGGTVYEKTEGVKAKSSGLNGLPPKHSERTSLGLLVGSKPRGLDWSGEVSCNF